MSSHRILESETDLIVLERGREELLVLDSHALLPLYVKRGGGRVKDILAELAGGRPPEQAEKLFPEDIRLIRLLEDHHILTGDQASPRTGQDRPSPPKAKGRITLYLLLGESCNLQCIYCLNGPETYRRDGRDGMNPEVAFRSVAACLEEAAPGGSVEVAFFGGEPLLHWPLVKRTISHCEDVLKPAHPDKHIHYHLTSNLTLSPPDLPEWVGRHALSVVCGIDGPPDIHDRCRVFRNGGPSHARTAGTIRRLARTGIPFTLRATITSANHHRLEEVTEHHFSLGATSSLFVPVRPVNSDRQRFPEHILPDPDRIVAAARALGHGEPGARTALFPVNDFSARFRPGVRHEVACGAPQGTTYVVRTDGDVYPCIYLVGQEKYCLGNVTGTLDHSPLDAMLESSRVDAREPCSCCSWRYLCGGGCLAMNMARNGQDDDSPVARYSRRITCEMSKALLSDAIWAEVDKAAARRPASLSD